MEKQVDAAHYRFGYYMTLPRWNSLWYQLDELAKLEPDTALEIGPGPGFFKALAAVQGIRIETVDLDPELKPDHVASVTELPFADGSYDVACAFQVLEHLPFETALAGLDELARVAKRHVLVSLPDAERVWRYSLHLPKLGERRIMLKRPRLSAPVHAFDGQHHWEINKRGYELQTVTDALVKSGRLKLLRTFRIFENPYHRFFVFAKTA